MESKKSACKQMIIVVLVFFICACQVKPKTKAADQAESPDIIGEIDLTILEQTVKKSDGFNVVVFMKENHGKSTHMENRMRVFADKFKNYAKFHKLKTTNDQVAWFGDQPVLAFPTVILFKDGFDKDRIKDIPEKEEDRVKWNDDIELWFYKNVVGLESDQYEANFTYRFNNTSKLHIQNFKGQRLTKPKTGVNPNGSF